MVCEKCGAAGAAESGVCKCCGVAVGRRGPAAAGAQGAKRWRTTLLLTIFAGFFGAHRFYTGHTGIGVVQLMTLGGCGILTVIDLITLLNGSYLDAEGKPLRRP